MSTARLYVGNLSYGTTKETLEKTFAEYGEVVSVNIITDRQTGRPKGFAFVELSTPEEGEAAKTALNGTISTAGAINVDNAREQEQRKPGGFGGRSEGGYGGGGGGGGYGGGKSGGGSRDWRLAWLAVGTARYLCPAHSISHFEAPGDRRLFHGTERGYNGTSRSTGTSSNMGVRFGRPSHRWRIGGGRDQDSTCAGRRVRCPWSRCARRCGRHPREM